MLNIFQFNEYNHLIFKSALGILQHQANQPLQSIIINFYKKRS